MDPKDVSGDVQVCGEERPVFGHESHLALRSTDGSRVSREARSLSSSGFKADSLAAC